MASRYSSMPLHATQQLHRAFLLSTHTSHTHPSTQAAEILLMMRPPAEAPSDFQEYTLVRTRAAVIMRW